MSKNDIKVNGHYKARIRGYQCWKVTIVRVDAIRNLASGRAAYDVTDTDSGRTTTIHNPCSFYEAAS